MIKRIKTIIKSTSWLYFSLGKQYNRIKVWRYGKMKSSQYPQALKRWYKRRTGETLDLENPETYNEKIQWLKLYDNTPEKTILADKFKVREWVAEKLGGGVF